MINAIVCKFSKLCFGLQFTLIAFLFHFPQRCPSQLASLYHPYLWNVSNDATEGGIIGGIIGSNSLLLPGSLTFITLWLQSLLLEKNLVGFIFSCPFIFGLFIWLALGNGIWRRNRYSVMNLKVALWFFYLLAFVIAKKETSLGFCSLFCLGSSEANLHRICSKDSRSIEPVAWIGCAPLTHRHVTKTE